MVQGFIVVVIVVLAVVVGQSYPVLGGLLATFPIKIFSYAVASDPDTTTEGIRGLFIGSVGSVICAATMWFTLRYGKPIALSSGLVAWSLFAVLGGLW